MIITERFIYLHQSKTGGTFVTDMLLRLHSIDLDARRIGWTKKLEFSTPFGVVTVRGPKHASCADIPPKHRGKPILASIRNPYDRYVSLYEFGWWKRDEYRAHYTREIPDLYERYPTFPDIRFVEFLTFANRRQIAAGKSLGAQTVSFVRLYSEEPDQVLANLHEDYIGSGAYLKDMPEVQFIRTDNLNRELHDFLLDAGYPSESLSFILESEKVLPDLPDGGKSRSDPWMSYYSPFTAEFVRFRERHLLALFPDFVTPEFGSRTA